MIVPDDLRYSTDHEWARARGRAGPGGDHRLRAGRPGRRRLRRPPEVGKEVEAGALAGRGGVDQVGLGDLRPGDRARGRGRTRRSSDAPERLNEDPYGEGWICDIELSDPGTARRPARRGRLPPAHRDVTALAHRSAGPRGANSPSVRDRRSDYRTGGVLPQLWAPEPLGCELSAPPVARLSNTTLPRRPSPCSRSTSTVSRPTRSRPSPSSRCRADRASWS